MEIAAICDYDELTGRFRRIAETATPGPWRVVQGGTKDRYEVASERSIVESNLAKPYADYLVCIREAATTLSAMVGRPSSEELARARRLAKIFAERARAVEPEWLFVAPRSDHANLCFMHNSAAMIGSGHLRREDAAFIDAAATSIPRLLERVGTGRVADGGRRLPDSARRLVIPKRLPDDDPIVFHAAFAEASNDLHALTGRHGLADRTRVMVDAILPHLDIRPGQSILDIGCGDASLLSRIAPTAARAVGTVLTEQERARLAADPRLSGIEFRVGSFETLDEIPGPFDWIVANGCLHFVKTRGGAERALDAIASRLTPHGKLWAGEMFAKEFRVRRTFGRIAALRHVRDVHGTRYAAAFARHMWRRRRRSGLVVEAPPPAWWHTSPDALATLAARHGFRIEGSWSCREMTGDTFYSLQDRFSCLLAR